MLPASSKKSVRRSKGVRKRPSKPLLGIILLAASLAVFLADFLDYRPFLWELERQMVLKFSTR